MPNVERSAVRVMLRMNDSGPGPSYLENVYTTNCASEWIDYVAGLPKGIAMEEMSTYKLPISGEDARVKVIVYKMSD